jgi:hypothetical protein
MVNLFRRHRQPLLIVLTILTILAFGVFYNPTRNQSQIQVASINGRPITLGERQHSEHRFQLMSELGMMDALYALIGQARSRSEAEEAFLWNTLVLRYEAEELGIISAKPSKDEQDRIAPLIAERIQKMPNLQTNGGFDYNKYANLTQGGLGSLGLTNADLDEVVIDAIRVDKVKEILGSTVAPSPTEVRERFTEQNKKLEASVIRLKFDEFKAAAAVTDEEVKKAFEERKESFKTAEKRKVKFIALTLAQQKTPLQGPAKFQALQELIKEGKEFAIAMTKEGAKFEDVAKASKDRLDPQKEEPKKDEAKPEAAKADAPKDDAAKAAEVKKEEPAKKYQVTTGETPLFTATEPPKELDRNAAVAQAAFKLTKESPTSDAISSTNGAYVVQLTGVEESRPETFEEVKEKLTNTLKEEKARETMSVKASDIRKKIEEEVKAGKPFVAAAEAAGTKPEKVPPFSSREQLRDVPDGYMIQGQASQLAIDELSQFVPTQAGGLLIHIDRQLPIDETEFNNQKEKLAESSAEEKARMMFMEWLSSRRKAASIQGARG